VERGLKSIVRKTALPVHPVAVTSTPSGKCSREQYAFRGVHPIFPIFIKTTSHPHVIH